MDLQILESLIKNLQDEKKRKPWYVWLISPIIIVLFIAAIVANPHCSITENNSTKETETQKTLRILILMTLVAILITVFILKS